MLDIIIISLYLVVLFATRNKLLLFAMLAFSLSALLYRDIEPSIYFSIIAVIYSLTALVVCMRSLSLALGLFSMSIYFIIFAIDTWINADVETWLYNHHEVIVSALHIVIVVSSSSRAIQIISSRIDNFINYCYRIKRWKTDNKNTCSGYSEREN